VAELSHEIWKLSFRCRTVNGQPHWRAEASVPWLRHWSEAERHILEVGAVGKRQPCAGKDAELPSSLSECHEQPDPGDKPNPHLPDNQRTAYRNWTINSISFQRFSKMCMQPAIVFFPGGCTFRHKPARTVKRRNKGARATRIVPPSGISDSGQSPLRNQNKNASFHLAHTGQGGKTALL